MATACQCFPGRCGPVADSLVESWIWVKSEEKCHSTNALGKWDIVVVILLFPLWSLSQWVMSPRLQGCGSNFFMCFLRYSCILPQSSDTGQIHPSIFSGDYPAKGHIVPGAPPPPKQHRVDGRETLWMWCQSITGHNWITVGNNSMRRKLSVPVMAVLSTLKSAMFSLHAVSVESCTMSWPEPTQDSLCQNWGLSVTSCAGRSHSALDLTVFFCVAMGTARQLHPNLGRGTVTGPDKCNRRCIYNETISFITSVQPTWCVKFI